jgi:hypothetical protein
MGIQREARVPDGIQRQMIHNFQAEITRLLLEQLDEEFDGDILDLFEPGSDYEITITDMYYDDDDELIANISIEKRG